MKVAIFFEAVSNSGGIFHQSMNTINYLKDKDFLGIEIEIVILGNYNENNFKELKNKIKIFNAHKYAERYNKLIKSNIIKLIFKKLKISNPFEKFIKKNNYDLIFFVSPSKYVEYCGEINFVVNLFDFNHRIINCFPEYKDADVIDETDSIILKSVKKAFKIFVNTDFAKNDLQDLYNCPNEKISVLNYNSNLIETHKKNYHNLFSQDQIEKKIIKLGLKKDDNFFFYPAQFWPHKNHKYLIDTAIILLKKKINFTFIFCGSKKMNYKYIYYLIKKNNLEANIKIFDYLDDDEVISLYLKTSAIIMPTYVGRSSLPLIESFYFKKTIFYSKGILDKEIERLVNSFDLNNPTDLSDQIVKFMSTDDKNDKFKIDEAYSFYNKNFDNQKSSKIILDVLNNFKYLKNRWK